MPLVVKIMPHKFYNIGHWFHWKLHKIKVYSIGLLSLRSQVDNMACFRSKGTEGSSNSSSSEDLDSLLGANRAFSGVVIDPVPAGVC